jgi:hypothetical protein
MNCSVWISDSDIVTGSYDVLKNQITNLHHVYSPAHTHDSA